MNYDKLKADTLEQLEVLINNFLQRYPIAGYGTLVSKPYNEGEQWLANVSWASSCD